MGRTTCSARSWTVPAAAVDDLRGAGTDRRVAQDATCWPSSARCSDCTSPTTSLFGVEHCPGRRCGRVDRRADLGGPRGGLGDDRGHRLSSVTRKITKAGAVGAGAVIEDLSGAIEVLFFPKTYESTACSWPRTPSSLCAGGWTPATRRSPSSPRSSACPRPARRAPAGPVRISLQPSPVHPAAGRPPARGAGRPPGSTEVHLELAAGERRHRLRLARRTSRDTHPGADGRPQGPAAVPARWTADALREPEAKQRCCERRTAWLTLTTRR